MSLFTFRFGEKIKSEKNCVKKKKKSNFFLVLKKMLSNFWKTQKWVAIKDERISNPMSESSGDESDFNSDGSDLSENLEDVDSIEFKKRLLQEARDHYEEKRQTNNAKGTHINRALMALSKSASSFYVDTTKIEFFTVDITPNTPNALKKIAAGVYYPVLFDQTTILRGEHSYPPNQPLLVFAFSIYTFEQDEKVNKESVRWAKGDALEHAITRLSDPDSHSIIEIDRNTFIGLNSSMNTPYSKLRPYKIKSMVRVERAALHRALRNVMKGSQDGIIAGGTLTGKVERQPVWSRNIDATERKLFRKRCSQAKAAVALMAQIMKNPTLSTAEKYKKSAELHTQVEDLRLKNTGVYPSKGVGRYISSFYFQWKSA